MVKYLENLVAKRGKAAVAKNLVEDPAKGKQRKRGRFALADLTVLDLPIFRMRTAELMIQSDPMVRFAMNVRNSALMPAELEIEADPDVKAWIEKNWSVLWDLNRPKLVKAKRFGSAAIQVVYENDKGIMNIDRLKEYRIQNTMPLQNESGETVGFQLRQDSIDLRAPQALWVAYQAEYGNPWGESVLHGAYSPWWSKWVDGGFEKMLQLRMMKDAYIGDMFFYPMGQTMELKDGTVIPFRDVVRELGENRLSGGTLTIPVKFDESGNKLIDYHPPQDFGTPTGILEWGNRLDDEILIGIGVPTEVVNAAEGGTGFSGRSIPLTVLINNVEMEFTDIVNAVVRDIFTPMIWFNFGEREWSVKPKSLLESTTEIMGESNLGGGAMGGTDPQPQQQQQGPEDVPRTGEFITVNKGGKQFQRRNPNFGKALASDSSQFADTDSVDPLADDITHAGTRTADKSIASAASRITALKKKRLI